MQQCSVCEAPLKVLVLLPRCNQGELVSLFGASMVKLCTVNEGHSMSSGALLLMKNSYDTVETLTLCVAHDRYRPS